MEAEPTVQSKTPDAPAYVPISTGWPKRHIPRWLWLAGAAFLVAAVLVALQHTPSQSQRASDLRGFLSDVNTDIESCAGGVRESLQALQLIQSGKANTAADVRDAISIAVYGAANCAPANNEQIDDLENYQVEQSLSSFRLAAAVTDLVDWAAPHAQDVQTDVANLLSAHGAQAKAEAQANLNQAIVALDQKRAAADSLINAAIKALGVHESGIKLPG
jgi:hypothetical protein